MYSIIDRKDILDKLEENLKLIEYVDGMILVGSGAEGFTDKWSDIDLSIVVCEVEKTRQVWNKINEKIMSNFDLIKISYNEYGENNFLSAILLHNYLEIDIGVLAINKLVAKGKSWSILYDKSGYATKKMNDTWRERKLPDLNSEIKNSLDRIWHNIKNGAFALRREKLYRAIKEIEVMRNEIVEISALRENKIAKHFKDVDDMDRRFIQRLGQTFFKEVTINELSRSFINSFNLYFDLIKETEQSCEEIIQYEQQLRKLLRE